MSGQFLVPAVTLSPLREELLLWRRELGLVFVTLGGTIHSSDKDVGQFFSHGSMFSA